MNTHLFDGQLSSSKLTIASYLSSDPISPQSLDTAYHYLQNKIDNPIMHRLIADAINFPRTDNRNHDPTNDLYIDEVLYLCYKIVINSPADSGVLLVLGEQLQDIQTGWCSQGRIYRLLQIVLAYPQYLAN